MATRKRTTRRSGLVGRAVSAGRRALKEAESRIPPDLRRQLDRRLKDADKTARAAIKQLQVQVKRASTRGDVNSLLKRIDSLTKQARQIASGTGSRPASTRRRAPSTTRKAATRTTPKAAGTTRRRATSTARRTTGGSGSSRPGRTSARRTSPRRSRRAETTGAMPEMVIEPAAIGEVEVIEITES